ncbi:MAG TPA: hypothetical protein VEW28_03530 [Candidatus Kapabacteria bacterium]|nr:hypothetical protein [Candidatus Kapabacteria bacterium]
MIRALVLLLLTAVSFTARAQELFIQTEPASNMPAGRFGLRVSSDIWQDNKTVSRFGTEVMYGLTKDLMVHLQAYGSNQLTGFHPETFGAYVKYRLYVDDGFKYHFRISAYGEALGGEQHSMSPALSFKGAGPIVSGGFIATVLENRLALSLTVGATRALKEISISSMTYSNITNLNSSFSVGYLIYPPSYTGYSDPNINVYAELLSYQSLYDQSVDGHTTSEHATEMLLSLGPQLILNSVARFDLAYAITVTSGFIQKSPNSFFARFEYNFY